MIRLTEVKVYVRQNGNLWCGTGYWNPADHTSGCLQGPIGSRMIQAFEGSWARYVYPHCVPGPVEFVRAVVHRVNVKGWGESHYRDYLQELTTQDPVRVTWKKVEGSDAVASQEGQNRG